MNLMNFQYYKFKKYIKDKEKFASQIDEMILNANDNFIISILKDFEFAVSFNYHNLIINKINKSSSLKVFKIAIQHPYPKYRKIAVSKITSEREDVVDLLYKAGPCVHIAKAAIINTKDKNIENLKKLKFNVFEKMPHNDGYMYDSFLFHNKKLMNKIKLFAEKFPNEKLSLNYNEYLIGNIL